MQANATLSPLNKAAAVAAECGLARAGSLGSLPVGCGRRRSARARASFVFARRRYGPQSAASGSAMARAMANIVPLRGIVLGRTVCCCCCCCCRRRLCRVALRAGDLFGLFRATERIQLRASAVRCEPVLRNGKVYCYFAPDRSDARRTNSCNEWP